MPSSTDQVGPRPTPRVWTEVALSPAPLARLQHMAIVTTEGTLEDLPDADVAVTGASVVDEAFLAQAGANLKMVARVGIGYEKVDVAACTAHGVLAVNTPDGPTESTGNISLAAGTHLIVLYDYALTLGANADANNGRRCFNVIIN